MRMKLILGLFVGGMLTFDCWSASPLSLKDAIAEAYAANLDLKSTFQTQRMAEADLSTAQLRPNPSLNLVGDVLPALGERFGPNDKYYGVSLSTPLDLWDRRTKRTEATQKVLQASKAQYQDVVRQVRLQVEVAYYTSLALRDRKELAEQILKRLDDFVVLSKLRSERGDIPLVDVSRAEFTREQYHQDVLNISTEYRASLINLQLLLGRATVTDSLELQSDIEDIMPPDSISVDAAFSVAVAHRPDYSALLHQVESDKANAQLQDALGAPDLSISGDYSTQQGARFYGLTLNIGLPLFNRNQGEREKSKYRIHQSELAVLSWESKTKAEIASAMARMREQWHIVQQQTTLLLPQSEQILKTVEYAYRSGNTTLIDYLEAQRSHTESRILYIQTLLNYHISQAVFESALSLEVEQ